jgi:C-terminal processing protease CtpA/Prc
MLKPFKSLSTRDELSWLESLKTFLNEASTANSPISEMGASVIDFPSLNEGDCMQAKHIKAHWMNKSFGLLLAAFSVLAVGCQNANHGAISAEKDSAQLRQLDTDERAQDFDQLLSLFKAYYGPYEYKERVLGINIAETAARLKAQALQAKTDEEFASYVFQFGATLRDGHVQIALENSANGILRYKVPVIITPVEKHAIVAVADPKLKDFEGLVAGTEILEIDGKSPFDYLPTILKYRSSARDLSNQHYILYALQRPSYMTDLKPTSPTVRLKIKTAQGETRVHELPWIVDRYNPALSNLPGQSALLDLRVPFAQDINSAVDAGAKGHIRQMGAVDPFFLTPQTQARFKFVKVYPSDAYRKAYDLKDHEKPPIYAALYKYQGKTVLLVREAAYYQEDFKPEVYLKAYQALLDEYQDIADVLVLDQTHNPGGSYCSEFYNIFARDNDVQSAEILNTDRKWINELKVTDSELSKDPNSPKFFTEALVAAWGRSVEKAYDANLPLSEAIPLFSGTMFAQKQKMNWTKPMLVLIDELAGSCGDMFPMLVKANKRAKLFGQTTMGLGGNVEEVGYLTNSRIPISMTRGLFFAYNPNAQPTDADFVENNGVTPDIPYEHTVADFRAGFVNYVKTFSDRALEALAAETASPTDSSTTSTDTTRETADK